MLRDKKTAVENWIKYCMEVYQAEQEESPKYDFKDTTCYQLIAETLSKDLVEFYMEHNKDLEDLFRLYGEKLYYRSNIAELLSSKYKDYSFVNDFIVLLGKEKAQEIGLNLCITINDSIEAANNPLIPTISQRELNQLRGFFEGKKRKLPENENTYEIFKLNYIVEALKEVENGENY